MIHWKEVKPGGEKIEENEVEGGGTGGTRERLEGRGACGQARWGAAGGRSAPLSLTQHLSSLWHCSSFQ